MGINLEKGGSIDLTKEAPQMIRALIGLGWKEQSSGGADFDLDASLFCTDENGQCKNEADFIFYKSPRSPDGAVIHAGDDRKGGDSGESDNEEIRVDLQKLAQHVEQIVAVVTIHASRERRQNFGMVSDAYIRIVDQDTGREVGRYDLTENFSTEDAVIVAKLVKRDGNWHFEAVGEGRSEGLAGLVREHGLSVA